MNRLNHPSRTSQGALVAEHLGKRYQARSVVDDVSIAVGQGEIVGLLGPNGAGKTTSFYMITGLVPIDTGKVFINGEDVTHQPMHKRAQLGLGYLAQEPSVFRKLSVADNILAILETTTASARERRRSTYRLLGELNVEHLRDSLGHSLSGGERRRVEIARALASEPLFMLLDEPFAGVDPISISDIQKVITYLKSKGIGVLITDHNVRETLGICDRAYIVSEGRIIAAGSADEILADQRVREVYLGEEFRL